MTNYTLFGWVGGAARLNIKAIRWLEMTLQPNDMNYCHRQDNTRSSHFAAGKKSKHRIFVYSDFFFAFSFSNSFITLHKGFCCAFKAIIFFFVGRNSMVVMCWFRCSQIYLLRPDLLTINIIDTCELNSVEYVPPTRRTHEKY